VGHGSQPSPQLLMLVGLHNPCRSLSAIDISLHMATAADLNMEQSFVSSFQWLTQHKPVHDLVIPSTTFENRSFYSFSKLDSVLSADQEMIPAKNPIDTHAQNFAVNC
jgi:hypothetical protein